MAKKQKRPAETWEWVPEDDRALKLEEQTTFVFRPLTQVERLEVRDNFARIHAQPDGSTATVTRTHRVSLDIVLSNTVEIRNFPAGTPKPWPEDRDARIAYLEMMDDALVKDAGNEIWVRSTIGADAKN